MRRRYAFEAEGVSEEVKSQLEIAEDAVEKNCETPEDCDKMLEKIDDQAEKFDNALQTMSDAAKDCKDGKCDASEMKDKITPAMADLKEVAQTIGIAKEGDEGPVTEEDLKDVKAYLEGAKEIVEAKKDELGGDDGECEEADEACEALNDIAIECYLDECESAMESVVVEGAMEGNSMDALGAVNRLLSDVRKLKKEMNKAKHAMQWSEAASKAREIAGKADALTNAINGLPQSTSSAVITNLALAIIAILAATAGGKAIGKFGGKKIGNAVGERAGTKAVKADQASATGKIAQAKVKAKMQAGKGFAELTKAQYNISADDIANARLYGMEGSDKEIREALIAQARARLSGGYGKMRANVQSAMVKTAAAGIRSGVKDPIVAKATKAGTIGGAVTGGAGVGLTAAGLNLRKILMGKKVVDSEGNVTKEKISPNEMNAVIVAVKAAAKSIKEHYNKLADEFEARANSASGAASESDTDFSYFEEGSIAMESVASAMGDFIDQIRNGASPDQIYQGLAALVAKRGKEIDTSADGKQLVKDAVKSFKAKIGSGSREMVARTVGGASVALLMDDGVLKEIHVPVVGSSTLLKFSKADVASASARSTERAARDERKAAKAAAKAAASEGGDDEAAAESFIAACESLMIGSREEYDPITSFLEL